MVDWLNLVSKSANEVHSRRKMLHLLAMFPGALIGGHKSEPPAPEEVLLSIAASLSACWDLINGNAIMLVEQEIALYLPVLIRWGRQPSRYQQLAADLAAQASLLMDLIQYHHFRFRDALHYATLAVELAEGANNANLLAYALILQGGAFSLNQEKWLAVATHKRAESMVDLFPALESYVQVELANSYAEHGDVQPALRALERAKELFPNNYGDLAFPTYIKADFGLFQLQILEAMTRLSLAQLMGNGNRRAKREHVSLAEQALASIDHLLPEQIIPERSRVEKMTYQAKIALASADLDQFEHYILLGARGARRIGSQKRYQEVQSNLETALCLWPNEKRVLHLREATRET